MYFKNFPTISYDVTGDGNPQVVSDILTRVAIRQSVRDRNSLFSKYDVYEWETPESVALDMYGKAEYHWVVLMFNKYYDKYYEWPMSMSVLQKYMKDKYSNPNAIHHYETSQSSGNDVVKVKVEVADVPTATPITNFEYEQELNDARKQIILLQPGYLGQFLFDFKNQITFQA
ncbi:MAG: baseplate wedge protein 53 [Anaerolineales bacterium]|nr:baseplate wedge protein 53 [Anaerolineales bacterium]